MLDRLRRAGSRATWLVASLLSACGPADPEDRGRPGAPEASPACTLGDAALAAPGVRARRGLALAGGWLFAADDALVAIAPDGARHRVERSSIHRLLAAAVIDGAPLAVFDAPSAEGAHAIVALDPTGGAPALERPLPGPLTTSKRAATERALYFAWSGPGGTRGLERLARDGGAFAHEAIALGDEPPSDEAPVEILGLAAERERWAAVWRRGPTEDARSRVYVSEPGGRRVAEALHEALTVEAMAFDADGLAVIAGFEFARPGLARFGEDESLTILAPGREAPPPLAERERAELDLDHEGLWLSRRDALGDPIGERVRVAEGPVEMATVERRGAALDVAWASADGVYQRTIRCR